MISPSQIVSFQKCPRKWALKSLAKIPYEPGPAAQFGITGHGYAEAWLLRAEAPPQDAPGRLMSEGIPYLPRPGTALVEIDFLGQRNRRGNALEIDGLPYLGYLDVLSLHEGRPRVTDHKFTSRPDLAHTVDTLRKDPQGILYPLVASILLGSDGAHSRWLYYPRTGRNVFPVDDYRTIGELHAAFHEYIVPTARLIKAYRDVAPTHDSAWVQLNVPCNPNICDWSGKWCDYGHICTMRNV